MNTTSHWSETAAVPRFRQINKDCTVDVAVIGAGITGITAAYLLKKAGHTVALLERGRCGGFDTANTTAHLTCVTSILRLHQLVRKFGKATARAAWDAGRAAIDRIYQNIQAENISCKFVWTPGYLHAARINPAKQNLRSLQEDAKIANELGFPAEFVNSTPLVGGCGVKFPHQAKFHPLKYLAALLRAIPGRGSHVFENTEAGEIKARPLMVTAGDYIIHCSYLIVATHTPLMGKANLLAATLLQSRLFLYTSYAVGAKIRPGLGPEAASGTRTSAIRLSQDRQTTGRRLRHFRRRRPQDGPERKNGGGISVA